MTDLINSLKTFASSSSPLRSPEKWGKTRATEFRNPYLRNSGLARLSLNLPMRDSCAESGFAQWRDAMRMNDFQVARLPGGVPTEFRLRLWENLADRWLMQNEITWEKIQKKIVQSKPRDREIVEQIDKDLHRTGCVGFSGQKQVVLKEVLLSFARWNGEVGYCQGLNMIGATLLQMTTGNKELTLKILIFMIEGVLPQGYFSQGLRGLAVDMAVFGEILKNRKPTLHAHLSRLQKRDDSPPLTDVFTMHWFLTLFIHCLPSISVLRIWDLLLLEGSEVLLRTALVLWAAIETRVLSVHTTDEFYSVMGVITREMIELGLLEPNSLVKCIVSLGSFPYPGLKELRERHRNPENIQKSFFLAKKELDALKRHYAAIRHRQRNTTIIMKNIDVPSRPKPKPVAQRNQPTHQVRRTGSSPKPRIRRMNTANNSKGSQPLTSVNKYQVTLTWDKAKKKVRKPRKRRASASSITTSSSSTELCDSSGDDSDSQKETLKLPQKIMPKPPHIKITPSKSLSIEETEAELFLLTENSAETLRHIDTSDSQHFLDELSKIDQLRKSYGMTTGEGNGDDNFYENLSQRICQLQFQNLTLLTHLSTGEKENTKILSPLPSPISPILSFHEHFCLPQFQGHADTSTPASCSRALSPASFTYDETINLQSGNDETISSKGEEADVETVIAQEPIENESKDEITNIIRENLEILQRLKLKTVDTEESSSEELESSSDSSNHAHLAISKTHRQNRRTFNPFPTSRKPRNKTSKFGLYK